MNPSPGVDSASARRLVYRNAAYLAAAQVLVMPFSVLANAVSAHYLGPATFGVAYLAGTLAGFGFLFVGWGHEAVLPAEIARNRGLSGTLLGTSLVWRLITSVVVYGILALGCHLLDYGADFQWALGLTCLVSALTYIVAGIKDTIRGLERTDIPAITHVAHQFLTTVLIVLALWLGGGLLASLAVQAAACLIVLVALRPWLAYSGVGSLRLDWRRMKELVQGGTPFVIFGLAMQLQPNIDAVFLSRLAPIEVLGWYAVSRRLVGVLILPASTLVSALYPTLCRLYATDSNAFNRTTVGALRHVTLLVVPVALGCALFPEIGVALFSRESFRPAEDNLRLLAVFMALLYFSMPLGTAIMAAGKTKAWSAVQCIGVAASLGLDPLLIPYFQARTGNGGLGLCVAALTSEALVLAFAAVLIPRAILNRSLAHLGAIALGCGAAMALVARLASPLTPYGAAPLSVVAYVAALWFTGGIDEGQRAYVKERVQRWWSRVVPSNGRSLS